MQQREQLCRAGRRRAPRRRVDVARDASLALRPRARRPCGMWQLVWGCGEASFSISLMSARSARAVIGPVKRLGSLDWHRWWAADAGQTNEKRVHHNSLGAPGSGTKLAKRYYPYPS